MVLSPIGGWPMQALNLCKWVARPVMVMALLTVGILSAAAVDQERDCTPRPDLPASVPVILRVALYPFTPDRLALFQKIESVFECENPNVNVVLISTKNATDNYYSDDEKKKKGFRFVEADVYEVDTILLSDFIKLGKISPISLPFSDFAPEGIAAVTRNGAIFGVPRWLCGNFLFYRRADTQIRDVQTWRELRDLLAARSQGLLVDFKGRSTLGEWYLTALASFVGVDLAQQRIVDGLAIDSSAISSLQDILAVCPVGYCRNEKLHNNTGFYARAFVRGQAPVYIGYSESISYGLREVVDNCLPTSGCTTENDIAVRALPRFDSTSNQAGIGWVDALAIDAAVEGSKKELALKFITKAVSEEVYQSILQPEWPYRSRYLLPARQNLSITDAPLYAQFLAAHRGRQTGTMDGLNGKLRDMAEKVDCALPIDRDDVDTRNACPK
jgi:thiamine pyridinylase